MKPPLPARRISPYAVLLGVVLIVGNSYLIAYLEMIWHITHMTILALPMNVLFALMMVTWLNQAGRHLSGHVLFQQHDLLVIYAMLAVGSAFVGHDCLPRLMGLMPYVFRFATPENDWEALLFPHLPRWLVVSDPRAVEAFYEGESAFFADGYFQQWLTPILAWSAVVFLLLFIFLCLTVIFRRQWVQHERLSYPIIQIPLELTSDRSDLLRNRLLWIGLGVAACINLINGLHYYFPALPEIPVRKYDLIRYFTNKPLNAIGSTPLRLHPYLIGLGFLIPLDLSFSVAFFYLLRKALRVMGSMTGIAALPGYPFLGEQGAGALLAVLAVACWTGRRHLGRVVRGLWQKTPEEDEEPISYRTAMLGLVGSILLLLFFSVEAGMSVWVFLVFLAIYLSIVVGLTRMRAELGPPIHAIGYVTPQYLMVSMLGTRQLRPGNLTMLSLYNWLSGASYASFRTHPMPHQMEAFKLAERARISNRAMFIALLIACVVGIEASLILYPHIIYKEGVAAGSEQILAGGADTYNFLASWLNMPRDTDWRGMTVMVGAFFASLGIMVLRTRFLWCPLHPAGYVIGVAPGTTDTFWFALLLTTIVKWGLMKYGGVRAYRRAIPFFAGLVLGETLIACFWALFGFAFRVPIYAWF